MIAFEIALIKITKIIFVSRFSILKNTTSLLQFLREIAIKNPNIRKFLKTKKKIPDLCILNYLWSNPV